MHIDRILGATIVGRAAVELINTIRRAMVAGLGLRRLAPLCTSLVNRS
jgi:pyruvate/2-oxoglutarate dehydrogenase complex dihydrolipoamide dehydrogenase (E3) component